MESVRKRNETKAANNSPAKKDEQKTDESKTSKFGPRISFRQQRVFTRFVVVTSVLFIVYFTSNSGKKELIFASQKENLPQRLQTFDCSKSYRSEIEQYPGCVPEKCGRFVSDTLVSTQEANILLKIAQKGLSLGGSDGGASILDIHSGALSRGKSFVNIYSLPDVKNVFDATDFTVYKIVKTKIQHAIAHNFGVDINKIHLTHPTFFSKMTNAEAKTVHDEYWHEHVDKETYESFHYTSLLYLTDYKVDFDGGRFIFTGGDDKAANRTVEPRKARVLAFTSGAENPHYVERVTRGTRYALTVSFTCDGVKAIPDPTTEKLNAN